MRWFDRLSNEDFDNLRKCATYNAIPLRDLRLWNVLSDELSHQAVLKIRDQGTFYYLIPENPSAVEWIIFGREPSIVAAENLGQSRAASQRSSRNCSDSVSMLALSARSPTFPAVWSSSSTMRVTSTKEIEVALLVVAIPPAKANAVG